MTAEQRRNREVFERREKFRASVKNDPELLRDLMIGLQHALPAAWEKLEKESQCVVEV